MKKLFVSVPMAGRAKDEILESIEKMHRIAEIYEGEELELMHTYIEDNPPEGVNDKVWYLAKSIEKLAAADVFIGICDSWEWKGCEVESQVARSYGIKSYEVRPGDVIKNYKKILEEKNKTYSVGSNY